MSKKQRSSPPAADADEISLCERAYPETRFGGFSHRDCTIEFFTRVSALISAEHRILDFGAGSGAAIDHDEVEYRRRLSTLKGRCAELVGCDIDKAVLRNRYLDRAVVVDNEAPLPFADCSFDLIYSNYVFEHVSNPAATASELLRVLKPGGYLCAVTPNRWGYVAVAASMIANRQHSKLLQRIQPERAEEDVFPTIYALNTPAAIRRWFNADTDLVIYPYTPEPAYHFNSRLIYSLFSFVHKHLPDRLATNLLVFARKY